LRIRRGIHERFGDITSFGKTATGVRMGFAAAAAREAALVAVATGWVAIPNN
jgi:hypothetical protein